MLLGATIGTPTGFKEISADARRVQLVDESDNGGNELGRRGVRRVAHLAFDATLRDRIFWSVALSLLLARAIYIDVTEARLIRPHPWEMSSARLGRPQSLVDSFPPQ